MFHRSLLNYSILQWIIKRSRNKCLECPLARVVFILNFAFTANINRLNRVLETHTFESWSVKLCIGIRWFLMIEVDVHTVKISLKTKQQSNIDIQYRLLISMFTLIASNFKTQKQNNIHDLMIEALDLSYTPTDSYSCFLIPLSCAQLSSVLQSMSSIFFLNKLFWLKRMYFNVVIIIISANSAKFTATRQLKNCYWTNERIQCVK